MLAAIRLAGELGVPSRVLGGGSNLLVSDAGVRGVVIHTGAMKIVRFGEGGEIEAEAGAHFPGLVRAAVSRGLRGLEGGVGIPGSIGGVLAMNAGAFDFSVGQWVERITVISLQGGKSELPREQIDFHYRASSFGDDVNVRLETASRHSSRVEDAVVPVHHELLWHDVDDLTIRRQGNGLGCVDGPEDVFPADLAVLAGDRDHRTTVEPLDVASRQTHVGGLDLDTGHQLRLFHYPLDGVDRLLETDHHSLAQSLRFGRADADDLQPALFGDFADDGRHLGRTDVDAHDVSFSLGQDAHLPPAETVSSGSGASSSNTSGAPSCK